jgi:hypothetical protein
MNFDWLEKHPFNDYSQFGEDGVLEAIFSVIGVSNQWCFECGASDGLFFSNTRRLLEQGWRGVLVEADKPLFDRLQKNSAAFGDRVRCVNETIGRDRRIESVLHESGAPRDIDLVVIDVDGQDYHLFNSLLRYRPRVVVIEFDCRSRCSDDLPAWGGAGQAGERAISKLAAGRFYTPVCRTHSNFILVKQPLDQKLDGAAIEAARKADRS